MRFSIIIIIFAVFLSSCGSKFLDEKENNNSISDANSITDNKPVRGFIQSSDDVDFYKIEVTSESTCRIELSGIKGVNLAIKVWKGESNPTVIKFIDDTRKSSPENMANLYCMPGIYYFEILHGIKDKKKKNIETPYILKFHFTDFSAEEKEPNDTIDDATVLENNIELKGYFSPAYNQNNYSSNGKLIEEDWYSLSIKLSDGKPKLLTVKLTGVERINSILGLYDQNNKLIKEVDIHGAGDGESLEGIGVLADTRYFIKVYSKGYNANHINNYYISATLSDYDPSTEMEPNNSFDQAGKMTGMSIKGKINEPDDKDYFYSGRIKQGYYTISCTAVENYDLVLVIYDSNRKKIMEINNTGAGQPEKMPDLYINNPVYIAVKSKNSDSESSNFYELYFEKNDISDLYDREPNETIKTSVSVTSRIVKGYTSFKNDKDYYLVTSQNRGKKNVMITAPKTGKITVSLTDPYGNIMQSLDAADGRTITLDEMFDLKNYILVESKRADYENNYILQFGE